MFEARMLRALLNSPDQKLQQGNGAHAPKDGTYILPGTATDAMTPEQKKKSAATVMERMQKGPIMIAAVRRGGFGPFTRGMIIQMLGLMAAAFLLTWRLLQTSGLSYARRVAFLAIAGLSASVIVDLPNWNWWGFSGAYTAVTLEQWTVAAMEGRGQAISRSHFER